MEGRRVSWDLERTSLENGNWSQLAKDKILPESTKGPAEYGNHSLVREIRPYEVLL